MLLPQHSPGWVVFFRGRRAADPSGPSPDVPGPARCLPAARSSLSHSHLPTEKPNHSCVSRGGSEAGSSSRRNKPCTPVWGLELSRCSEECDLRGAPLLGSAVPSPRSRGTAQALLPLCFRGKCPLPIPASPTAPQAPGAHRHEVKMP